MARGCQVIREDSEIESIGFIRQVITKIHHRSVNMQDCFVMQRTFHQMP